MPPSATTPSREKSKIRTKGKSGVRIPVTVSTFIRHPRLVLSVQSGRVGVMKRHAAAEIARARKIYERNAGAPLREIISCFDKYACYNYKTTYMYAVTRVAAPSIVVETGVASGVTTYAILQALEDIRRGKLYSVDLPNATEKIPSGQQPGFIVPERLRGRWNLTLGDSKELLPALLDRLGTVDMFCHDSLHTYEHMTFEYRTAWPHVRSGGMLFSDDVESSGAFVDFCGQNNVVCTVLSRRELGRTVEFGWVHKP